MGEAKKSGRVGRKMRDRVLYFDLQEIAAKVEIIEVTVAELASLYKRMAAAPFEGKLRIDGGARIDEAHSFLIEWMGKAETEWKLAIRIPPQTAESVPDLIPESASDTGPNVAKSDKLARSDAGKKSPKGK